MKTPPPEFLRELARRAEMGHDTMSDAARLRSIADEWERLTPTPPAPQPDVKHHYSPGCSLCYSPRSAHLHGGDNSSCDCKPAEPSGESPGEGES